MYNLKHDAQLLSSYDFKIVFQEFIFITNGKHPHGVSAVHHNCISVPMSFMRIISAFFLSLYIFQPRCALENVQSARRFVSRNKWSQKKQAVLKSTLQSLSGSAHAWFSHIERNKKPRQWEKKFRQNWLSFGVWLAILRSQNLVKFTLKLRRLPQYYALIPPLPSEWPADCSFRQFCNHLQTVAVVLT